MIKVEKEEILSSVNSILNEVEEIDDSVDRFKKITEDVIDNNKGDVFFPKLEENLEKLIEALDKVVVDDIKEVFQALKLGVEIVEEVDNEIKGEIDK